MDKPTRNLLFNTTQAIRRLLEEEFALQLEGIFDIMCDGGIADAPGPQLSPAERLVRKRIVDAIHHRRATGESAVESVGGYLSEAVFTFLNRFAALKMMESRGLVLPCVSQGDQSQGFKEFSGLAPGLIELPDRGYRLYLESLFDEIGCEVGILFDRTDAASQLWPRRKTLEAVQEKINNPALAGIWAEDETIGWIYQYYNDPEERRRMREESAAPRNSREMAVRNQFFTPRYVVEFLADNSLGRLWYEMTRGGTGLKDQCRYLIRLPNEVFLKPGEAAPEQPKRDNLSQEDLVIQPVFIPHRPLKDPRAIRMLDPACGSMHFGLYAFDLFEAIYAEAWEMEESGEGAQWMRLEGMRPLRETWPDREAFLRDVPRLIIAHNIHGIDIDPRCAQIAGLALWLRAQKSWQRLGVRPTERPPIRRSNIVCAEPMPGEKDLLREFVESQFAPDERALFLHLLETIFDKMRIAGEAGSLLRIEDEIKGVVEEARQTGQKLAVRAAELFGVEELNRTTRQPELSGLEKAVAQLGTGTPLAVDFWDGIEALIYKALSVYAEQAQNGGAFQRRLFSEDAASGFAFIHLCRQRYDVALMNPPFGDASIPSKAYIEETYGDTKGDVYKAFVECFHYRLVPSGYLGIISSRTGFFLGQSEDWRTRVVLRLFRPIALADLGSGVLDAMVEVAAYVLRNLSETEARDLTLSLVPILTKVERDKQDRFSLPKWQAARDGLKRHQAVAELEHLEANGFVERSPGQIARYTPFWHAVKNVTAPPAPVYPPLVCVRALDAKEKGDLVREAVIRQHSAHVYICEPGSFSSIRGSPFSYWVGDNTRAKLFGLTPVEAEGREVAIGASTKDDFRFLRLLWELLPEHKAQIGGDRLVSSGTWIPIAKGGAHARFFSGLYLAINWRSNGEELKALISEYRGCRGWGYQWSAELKPRSFCFRPGLTWSRRSQKGFSLRALPPFTMFGDKGPVLFVQGDGAEMLLTLLGVMNSAAFRSLLALQVAFGSYEIGIIQSTVLPTVTDEVRQKVANMARCGWAENRAMNVAQETSHSFGMPSLFNVQGATLTERAVAWAVRLRESEESVAAIQAEIDDLVFRLYGLNNVDRAALTATLTTEATADSEAEAGKDEEEEVATADAPPALTADLLAYALGCAFGRWDIRFATGARQTPEPSDPFDPLPVCPPGMLQNAQGLPAAPADVPGDYPLRITWTGILADDPGATDDIVTRISEVLHVIWGDRAEAIEVEACEILEVKGLREFFRRDFFARHLKAYSKSRRQAPIYWPLGSPKGLYTVWLYYHRLTPDTLFSLLRDHVKPKLDYEERRAFQLKQEAGAAPTTAQRQELADAEDLVEDLRAFRDELNRVAPLFHPNLNDGVIINHAPLWRMIGLPKWRKDCHAAWEQLVKGDYDWSHLSMHLWPERVVPNCATDRSLAIAHGLDEIFWQEDPDKPGKWIRKKIPDAEVQNLIVARTSAAVKSALESLCGSPASEGTQRRGRRKASV